MLDFDGSEIGQHEGYDEGIRVTDSEIVNSDTVQHENPFRQTGAATGLPASNSRYRMGEAQTYSARATCVTARVDKIGLQTYDLFLEEDAETHLPHAIFYQDDPLLRAAFMHLTLIPQKRQPIDYDITYHYDRDKKRNVADSMVNRAPTGSELADEFAAIPAILVVEQLERNADGWLLYAADGPVAFPLTDALIERQSHLIGNLRKDGNPSDYDRLLDGEAIAVSWRVEHKDGVVTKLEVMLDGKVFVPNWDSAMETQKQLDEIKKWRGSKMANQPMVDMHWIEDEGQRKEFWATAHNICDAANIEKASQYPLIHDALSVEHVKNFLGSPEDAYERVTRIAVKCVLTPLIDDGQPISPADVQKALGGMPFTKSLDERGYVGTVAKVVSYAAFPRDANGQPVETNLDRMIGKEMGTLEKEAIEAASSHTTATNTSEAPTVEPAPAVASNSRALVATGDMVVDGNTGEILIDFNPIKAIAQAKGKSALINRLVSDKVLIEGVDYGAVPGTDKPTLLKPGAEKLLSAFSLYDKFVAVEKTLDWKDGFFFYEYECTLFDRQSGKAIGSGIGSCNSMEKKHRFRWVTLDRVPKNLKLDELAVKGGKISEPDFAVEKAETTGKYGKPAEYWRQFKVAIQNGSAVRGSRKSSTGKDMLMWEIDATMYGVPNEDIYDLVNTINKMAQKRALVAAALNATGASAVFSQDLEDFSDFGLMF